jgi:hypothetical protein
MFFGWVPVAVFQFPVHGKKAICSLFPSRVIPQQGRGSVSPGTIIFVILREGRFRFFAAIFPGKDNYNSQPGIIYNTSGRNFSRTGGTLVMKTVKDRRGARNFFA